MPVVMSTAPMSTSISVQAFFCGLFLDTLMKTMEYFCPDYQRNLKVFNPLDFNARCIYRHTDSTSGRHQQCRLRMGVDKGKLRAQLRNAILSGAEYKQLPAMLRSYAYLCTCWKHRKDNVENLASLITLAKRWQFELEQSHWIAAILHHYVAQSTLRQHPGYFPFEEHAQSGQEQSSVDKTQSLNTTQSSDTVQRSLIIQSCTNRSYSTNHSSAASSGAGLAAKFYPYWPIRSAPRLSNTITRPLDKTDLDWGYLYVLDHPLSHKHVKIGFTKIAGGPTERNKQWRRQCEQDFHLLTSSRRCELAKHVESLVHADLYQYRRILTCGKCDTDHNEWFEVTPERAEQVVHYWLRWNAELSPYSGITLKSEHISWMFLDSAVSPEEQSLITDRVTMFCQDSNNVRWIDKTLLGIPFMPTVQVDSPTLLEVPHSTIGEDEHDDQRSVVEEQPDSDSICLESDLDGLDNVPSLTTSPTPPPSRRMPHTPRDTDLKEVRRKLMFQEPLHSTREPQDVIVTDVDGSEIDRLPALPDALGKISLLDDVDRLTMWLSNLSISDASMHATVQPLPTTTRSTPDVTNINLAISSSRESRSQSGAGSEFAPENETPPRPTMPAIHVHSAPEIFGTGLVRNDSTIVSSSLSRRASVSQAVEPTQGRRRRNSSSKSQPQSVTDEHNSNLTPPRQITRQHVRSMSSPLTPSPSRRSMRIAARQSMLTESSSLG
jgi:hypothetical protein